jgi:hypothetical protein
VTVRVYVPLTLPLLGSYDAAGLIPAEHDRFVAPDDSEESEYDALMAAADASAELVGELGAGLRRRVVLTAEVQDADGAIPMRLAAAVHVDPEDDADPDDDLAWYATQEIGTLI